MTVATIILADPSQPTELQAWFDSNPDITTFHLFMQGNIFYVVY